MAFGFGLGQIAVGHVLGAAEDVSDEGAGREAASGAAVEEPLG